MNYIFLSFYVLLCLALILICKKYSLLVDYKIELHKRYSSNTRTHYLGGLFFLIFVFYNFFKFNEDLILLIFYICIFIIGFLSDTKKLNNVKFRFISQILLILLFVYLLNLNINDTRINLLNELLQYKVLNILFVVFCLLVLINGGNFIDGINGLLIKYNLLIFLTIYLFFQNFSGVNSIFLIHIILVLSVLLILNLGGFIYMGDSGAYLLSIFTGIYLIKFATQNPQISPYMIIILLWYPCFELLFSMIRRLFRKNKTYEPDTFHLHQIIYSGIKKIAKFKNNLSIHIITSFVLNSYNLIIFIIASKFIYSSLILNFIILLNIFIYIYVYLLLKKRIINKD